MKKNLKGDVFEMKKNKLLAILLCVAMIFTQFSMLGIVSAETTALTRRSDFIKGVNIHPSSIASGAYINTYDTILEAQALGANFIRTKITFNDDNQSYDIGTADLAAKYGMQVMAVAPIEHYTLDEQGNKQIIPADQVDIEGIAAKYEAVATALQGKVAYYQLDNELNGLVKKDNKTGLYSSDFNDVSGLAVALYAANAAIKEADPSAKTVINFSSRHIGFIDALKAVEIDADTGRLATEETTNVTHLEWDVIGFDWYSHDDNYKLTNNGYENIDYDYVIEAANERYPDMPVIVCEANIRPESENADGSIVYEADPSWIADFANYCYDNEKVIGFFAFELYDEPQHAQDGFSVEAYHGLIDKDGNKKPTYEVVRGLFGGTGVVADRTISATPALNNEGALKVAFQNDVVSATFPRVYSEMEVLTVENQATDFTQGNFIEFDLYVEDAQALKAAMSRLDINLAIQAYSDAETYRVCSYITEDYILADGWNHIKVAKGAFFDRSSTTADVDWANINKFVIKFYGHNIANYAEMSGMKLAIANICSTNVSAPENVVNTDKIVIDADGYAEPINRQVGWFSGNSGKALSPVVNLSSCEKIEFDLYVDNLELFSKTTETNELRLRFISDSTESQVALYYISKYVTNQGWNHIEINVSDYDYVTQYFSSSNINKYRLEFAGTSGDELPYPAVYIAFKNFNAVKYVRPELPSNIDKVVMDDSFSKILGEGISIQHVPENGGYSVRQFLDSPVNLSNSDYIEFDVYVENVDILKAYSNLYLSLYTNNSAEAGYRADYEFANQVTKVGWNHIKVAKSAARSRGASGSYPYSFDWTKVTAVVLMTYSTGAPSGVTGTANVIIANVCGTLAEYKVVPELPENTTVSSTAKAFNTYGDNTSNIRTITKVFDAPLDLSTADYIEFDIYVENVAHFWEYQTTMQDNDAHYFGFYLTSLANYDPWNAANYLTGQKAVYRRFVEFKDQITKDGWNHVKIAVGDWNVGKDGGLSSIVRAGFFTTRGAVNTLYTTENIGFANVCGTLADYKVAPKLPENAIVSSTDMVLNVYGSNTSNIVSITKVFDAPLNLSTADYIEFDIYVENVAHFWEYQTTMQDNDAHYFGFYLTSLANYDPWNAANYLTGQKAVYRRFVEFKDQITKDGWNHVKIAVGDWNVGKDGGLSSIVRAGFFTTRGAVNTLYATEKIGFANVCGTVDITVPTDVMKDKIDFIGATLQQITFNSEGIYEQEFDAVDISATKMIELDVFITNSNVTSLDVEFVDGDGNYAVYTFENLTTGWNHLGKRLADAVEGEVDFTNIIGYALYGKAKASVIVSNFYAADYVDGDGNRDGEVNILDLVRMKKYSCEISMTGNAVAMDVKGNDYEVNSLDLIALRVYLLTDKWPEN